MSAKPAVDLGFVHRFEPATDPNQPALLLLHGTGGDENDLLPLGRAIAPGAALLSVRGKVLENGMPRFFRRLAEGVFDQEDLAFRIDELHRFIHLAAERYSIPLARLVALGFSNGANIAAGTLLRHPGDFAGALLIRAMVPFIPESAPDLGGKPILLLSGTNDPIVPRAHPEQLAEIFRQGGANVTLQWENSGHSLSQGDLTAAIRWLREFWPLLSTEAGNFRLA